MHFVAGDISPNGQYLVLLGFSNDDTYGNLLALVDLTNPNYSTELLPLATNSSTPTIHCVDIAFHPTTGILYGFDHRLNKLITIDMETRIIDNEAFPEAGPVKGDMPSLFFDAFGQLFGIAYPDEEHMYRNIYQLDPATGLAKEVQALGIEQNQDACSCPYQVNLYNEVSYRQAYHCSELTFTLTLVNRSPFVQTNLKLRDTFPKGLIIKRIEENPFEARMTSGIGTNILAMDGIDLPIGERQMKVVVSVGKDVPKRIYYNQAHLENVVIRNENVRERRRSDDPQTPTVLDATQFEIKDLEVVFGEDFPIICPGESVVLSPGIQGASTYQWNTGAKSSTIEVDQEGFYALTVTTPCGMESGAIYVGKDEVKLSFSQNIEVEEGTEVELVPDIQSDSPIKYYYWKSRQDSTNLACLSCPNIMAMALPEMDYSLTVENENGCMAEAEVRFNFVKFQYYVPNAFSPDNDGNNDLFFPVSGSDFKIRSFRIFDRWGGLLYERNDCNGNDPSIGWDGKEKGELLDPGIYIWSIHMETAGGRMIRDKGEIYLFR